MVQEAVDRLDLDLGPVINFLYNKVATYPALLATEFGLPLPLANSDCALIAFEDKKCASKGHFRTSILINVKPVMVIEESTLAILRIDLDKVEFVAVMHHEPPKSLPYADHWDLLTIRTMDHAFHIMPLTKPFDRASSYQPPPIFQGAGLCPPSSGPSKIPPRRLRLGPRLL